MAVQLYRAGNTHTVRGIDCEVCNFALTSFDSALADGWKTTPEEIGDDSTQVEETQGNDEEGAEKEAGEEKAVKALDPRRIKARDAGIVGWDIKRYATLEAELNAIKD